MSAEPARAQSPTCPPVFDIIGDRTDASLAYLDRDFNFIWVNATYADKCGHTKQDLLGRNHFELFPNEENQAIFEHVRDTGEVFEVRAKPFVYAEHPEWGVTYWDWTLSPVKDESGQVQGLVLSLMDVTEQKRAEQALRESEDRYRTLFTSMSEGFALHRIVLDASGAPQDYVFVEVNNAFENLTGLRRADVVGKTVREVLPDIEPEWIEIYGGVALTGKPVRFESYSASLDKHYEVFAFSPSQGMFAAIFVDVTERKKATTEREAFVSLLSLANQPESLSRIARSLLRYVGELADCEAMAVRVRNHGDYPYLETIGFDYDFVEAENRLCAVAQDGRPQSDGEGRPVLECMCGNIICGRFDASKSYFTERGSFWTNSTTDLKAEITDDDTLLANIRGRCVESFESVALIPLRSGGETIGLLQLNDRRRDRFSPRLIGLIEEAGAIIANVIARRQAEDALRESNQRLSLLSNTAGDLLVSDDPQGLAQALCQRVMAYLDCHVFFNYLVDEERGRLHLNACAGIPKSTARKIEWLDYGAAVCGCVARDGRVIVAERVQETSDPKTALVKSLGIRAYACHPLLSRGGRVIGTLSFGTRSRDAFTDDDLSLMKTVSDQVASAMEKVRLLSTEQRRAAELQSFVSSMADGIALLNARGEAVFMNDALRQMLGVSAWEPVEDLLTRCRLCSVEGEPLPPSEAAWARALAGETVRELRQKVVTPFGREISVSSSASPVRDASGQVVGATNVFRDITETLDFERRRQELYRREHRIAETLQQALVPSELPDVLRGCPIAAIYEPALNEAEVGGDFFDIFEIGQDKLGVLIGDVAGKGLRAAMRVGAARHAVRSYAFLETAPGMVMTLTNNVLMRDTSVEDTLLTAFFAVVDIRAGTLTYANGGHEPPVVCAEGRILELQVTGPALGIDDSAVYEEVTLSLAPGNRLVAVTDGITEARRSGVDLFGKDRFLECLLECATATVEHTARCIVDSAREYAGGHLQDDAAVVVIGFQ